MPELKPRLRELCLTYDTNLATNQDPNQQKIYYLNDMLAPNTLALIALCNEYCTAIQNPQTADPELEERSELPFVEDMLRLLPRIYMCATTAVEAVHNDVDFQEDDVYMDNALDEDYYDNIRSNLENILGPEDTYLEVFHQDMKYSDTPIAASISEGLSDLFQVFYNFVETVRDATDETTNGAVVSLIEDFESYWSTVLCNVLRALNHVRYNA